MGMPETASANDVVDRPGIEFGPDTCLGLRDTLHEDEPQHVTSFLMSGGKTPPVARTSHLTETFSL